MEEKAKRFVRALGDFFAVLRRVFYFWPFPPNAELGSRLLRREIACSTSLRHFSKDKCHLQSKILTNEFLPRPRPPVPPPVVQVLDRALI